MSMCHGNCTQSGCGGTCHVGCTGHCLYSNCGYNCGGDETIDNIHNCTGLCISSSCSATGRHYNETG